MLSTGAFNAFLKTLEEPPHHAIFILATTEKHKLLATILSRCQIYDFNRIRINDIVEYLEYVAQQENIKAEKEALNVIAQKADGGMRDALSIFDQVASFSQGDITYKSVIDNLNVLDYEYYFTLTEAVIQGDVSNSLLLLNEILGKGFDGQHIITGMASFFRDVLVSKDPQTIVLFEVGDAVKEKYVNMAQQCPVVFLYKAIELTNECDLNYRVSKNKRLLIELLLIRLCQFNQSAEQVEEKKKVIEPIAQPQPTQSPNGQKEVQVAVSSQPSQPIQPKEEPAKKPVNTVKPMSISLKKHHVEKVEEKAVETEEKVVLSETFDQVNLLRVWKDYANQENDDIHLKNTMLNFSPILKENYQIEVEVSNPTQEVKLKEKMPDIYSYLSTQLNNTSIQIEVKLNEENTAHQPFTDRERFQFMASKNPVLNSLVGEFNLRLE